MQTNSPLDPRVRIGHVHLRVTGAGITLEGASDHGVSEALYLRDPDQNGIELYRDRPSEQWPRTAGGQLAMITGPLDPDGLLAEVKSQGAPEESPLVSRRGDGHPVFWSPCFCASE